jgi:hypothetical protein
MGLRATPRNESQDVAPAKAGAHDWEELDSRFRGNDVTFDGAERSVAKNPHLVAPPPLWSLWSQ